ncbi:MAG: ABC transporter permease [Acidobacteriota bacterium]
MAGFVRDIRFAIRTLLRAPGFTAVAVLTLALGIGANTAIFSVFNGVLLRPLSYAEPERLVAIFRGEREPLAPANFLDLAQDTETLESLVAAHPWSPVLRGSDRPEQIAGLKASRALFELLGVEPATGRAFEPLADADAPNQVVVLSHGLWQRRFGGDPGLIGRTLSLDGEPYTVVGVMPEGFEFPPFWSTGAELWVPLDFEPELAANRTTEMLRIFGRLKPGVELEQAHRELSALERRLVADYPDDNDGLTITLEALREPVVGGVRNALVMLLGTVGVVLLIACVNVANLFLVRASSRRGEIAIRRALGAGSASLVRQLVAESLVLALAAGVLGLLLGLWGIEALVALSPENVPRLEEISLDGRVLGFTLGVALLTGCLFGIFPALTALGWDLRDALREGSQRVGEGRRDRARNLLVVAEISLSLVLLVGAGLTLQSLLHLWRLDPGFRTTDLLTVDLSLAGSQHAAPERQNLFFDQLLEEVGSAPGVASVGLINHLPIGGDIWSTSFQVEGQRAASISESPRASNRTVTSGLFEVMGVPLLEGRFFNGGDLADTLPVVVVSQTLAERYWPAGEAVGQRIQLGGPDADGPWLTVVGVVGDVRQWQLTDELIPGLYYPYPQNPLSWWSKTTLVVRTEGSPESLKASIPERIWDLERDLSVASVRTMAEILSQAVWRQRFNASLSAVFAALAVLLAAVGIYGVVSYTVNKRRAEIGVRMALGAGRRQILQLVVGQGMWLTVAGLVIGLISAVIFSRLLESLLFGIGAIDLPTFLAVSVLLALVALVACYLPARRASRFDPLSSLRNE